MKTLEQLKPSPSHDELAGLADIVKRIDAAAGRPTAKQPAPPEVADVVLTAKAGIDALRHKLDDLEKKIVDQAADTSWSMNRLAAVGANAAAECARIEALIEQWVQQLVPPRTS